MEVRDGKLVVELAKPKRRAGRYSLEQLVAGITSENRHPELEWGGLLATKAGDRCPVILPNCAAMRRLASSAS